MPLTVTNTRSSSLTGLSKNYGRRIETIVKKACECFVKDGGRYTNDDGLLATDQCRILVISEYRGQQSMFTTHLSADWPPERDAVLKIPHRQLPQDFIVKANPQDIPPDQDFSDSIPQLYEPNGLRANDYVKTKPIRDAPSTIKSMAGQLRRSSRSITPAFGEFQRLQSVFPQCSPEPLLAMEESQPANSDSHMVVSAEDFTMSTSSHRKGDADPQLPLHTINPRVLDVEALSGVSGFPQNIPHSLFQQPQVQDSNPSPSPYTSPPRISVGGSCPRFRSGRRRSVSEWQNSRSSSPCSSTKIHKSARCAKLSKPLRHID